MDDRFPSVRDPLNRRRDVGAVPVAIVSFFSTEAVFDEISPDSEVDVSKLDVRATDARVEDEDANDAPETVRRIARKEFFIER